MESSAHHEAPAHFHPGRADHNGFGRATRGNPITSLGLVGSIEEPLGVNGLNLVMVNGTPQLPVLTRHRFWQVALKRAFDLVSAALAILVLAPVLFGLAILIKTTSPGPVLFRQKRTGFRNEPFLVFKFRTMHIHHCDEDGVQQAVANDARTTGVGRWIRRYSLDELPQLFNVVLGDMSLVGPRPFVPKMEVGGGLYSEITPYFSARHIMRPGITGWAQANGLRGPVADRAAGIRRLHYDIAYIQNFSLWLDIKILVKTILRELRGPGV